MVIKTTFGESLLGAGVGSSCESAHLEQPSIHAESRTTHTANRAGKEICRSRVGRRRPERAVAEEREDLQLT
jgi:hypothetical protein